LRLFRLQHLLSLQRQKIGATPAVETSPPSFHFACSCASALNGWAASREEKMDKDALRAIQAPIKERYRAAPQAAVITLRAQGAIDEQAIACKVETGRALAIAGLHPATGGSGLELCSGDMLLEALVACAGVTLKAVATALDIPLRKGAVRAEGDLDFRGTLGVDKEAAVGFKSIRLAFDLDTDASDESVAQLIKLTERYCVVYQTLNKRPDLSVAVNRSA
jgi:uncharacterized OsmC-like protein